MRFAELSTLLLFLGLGLASNEEPYKVKCGVSGKHQKQEQIASFLASRRG